MKIVIIENPRPLSIEHYNDVANAPLSASLNSGYAAATAREAGWDTAFLDFTDSFDDVAVIADTILMEGPDIILLHWVYSWGSEDRVRDLLSRIKMTYSGEIGAFGLFPTLAGDRLALYAPQLDFIIRGEFEETLQELLLSFPATGTLMPVPGIYRITTPFIRRNLISDMSQLPIPDDLGANCRYPSMNIAISRGCFGECSFCFINLYYGCRRRRERSVASFEHELETRLKRREIKSVYFIDPTFIGYAEQQRERVTAIGRILKGHDLPFGLETRVDTIDPERVDTLARHGATSIFLGIESGCSAALERIKKKITKDQIVRAVTCIQESSIALTVGFIMFEPDSTCAELLENYSLLEQLCLLSHHDQTVNLLYHSQIVLYGSKAWSQFESQGRLLLDDRLPFEANYRFRNADVARVCAAMKRLSAEYFILIDQIYRRHGISCSEQFGCCHTEPHAGINDHDLNLVLKTGFLAFVTHGTTATPRQFSTLVDRFVENLHACFS